MSLPLAHSLESSHLFFVGTYTKNNSRGIYVSHLDATSGIMATPQLAAELGDPTFLAFHPNGKILYAIGTFQRDGKDVAGVSAYSIDAKSGETVLLNQEASGGVSLTHLAVDATARMLIAVSYGGGYVVSFPLLADGRVGSRTTYITHQGPLGPNTSRQDKPHPHSVTISPDNRFAFVADLGLDRVFSYRLDPATATMSANEPAFITIQPGSGPRHTKFSTDGKFFYVLNEIVGTITVCAYDASRGAGRPIQTISTLPAGFVIKDPDRAAEIRIHPNGKFLYASNRGHDSIAVFSRDAASGLVTLVEIVPCGGKEPRNIALSPDGAWLISANQNSDTLTRFQVDTNSGRITLAKGSVVAPMAVCVLFAN